MNSRSTDRPTILQFTTSGRCHCARVTISIQITAVLPFVPNSSNRCLSSALSIYTVARPRCRLSSILSSHPFHVFPADPRASARRGIQRRISRNFRVVSAVIGKRRVGGRPALIMAVESARVEARSRAWRRATPGRLSLHALADLLRFSFEQILDGNATTRIKPCSFRFGLPLLERLQRSFWRAHTNVVILC